MRKTAAVALIGVLGLYQEAAVGQLPQGTDASRLIGAFGACREQADGAARLRCYDEAAAQLQRATQSGEVVVLTRDDVRRARRSLFGFTVPRVPFLSGGGGGDEEPAQELTAPIAAVSDIGHGRYRLRLEDGAVWETSEANAGFRTPRVGQTVRIRRGALGSYFIQVEGGRNVRGRRVS